VAQMVDAQGPEFNPQYCQKTKKLIISVWLSIWVRRVWGGLSVSLFQDLIFIVHPQVKPLLGSLGEMEYYGSLCETAKISLGSPLCSTSPAGSLLPSGNTSLASYS
jgi:hypothetical protein